jgi:hypothetical protein
VWSPLHHFLWFPTPIARLWYSSATKDNSADGLEAAIHKFEDYDIPEYREFKNLLINWHDEILNSFTIVENRRINNLVRMTGAIPARETR